jgi:signal transduction histidine kinase
MLHDFLSSHRDEVIGRTRTKAAARPAQRATSLEIAHGIPLFVDQLIGILKGSTPGNTAMAASATQQGDDMLRMGFTVGQVVHGYGDVCQAVTELAFEVDAPITVDEFRTLNRCLDDAIANAVTEYGRLRELTLVGDGTERLGALAHEMRNRLNTAMLSLGILRNGTVAVSGSTGAVLERSLRGLADLIDGALTQVRVEASGPQLQRIDLAEFVEETEIDGIIEARSGDHHLTVEPPEYGVIIEADRQLLATAVANLLQNAFKFTQDGGHVRLRTQVSADRVLIHIEDECGGLPPGQAEDLFRPFTQRSTDRTGLGLGLTISRKAIRLIGGELSVRNLPGLGCVFTVDLPRKDELTT